MGQQSEFFNLKNAYHLFIIHYTKALSEKKEFEPNPIALNKQNNKQNIHFKTKNF